MQSTGTQVLKLKARKELAVLLTIGFISQFSSPALAQGFDGFPAQSQSFAASQDAFLPPEVVPQADAGAGQMVMGATQGQLTENAPDAHMNLNTMSGTMSAKDMRKAAFDSLLGNTQLSNQMPQYDPNQGLVNPTPLLNQAGGQGQYAVGQPDWLQQGSLTGVNNQNTTPSQYANASQTQTLTGGSKVPIVRRDTRRGGFANNLAGGAGLGAGLLTTQLRRPNSLFGLGFMGATMTGFGVRNGFRF